MTVSPRRALAAWVTIALTGCATGSGPGAPATPSVPARVLDVTLQVLSPGSGDVLETPVTVRYRINGPDAADVTSLVVYVGHPGSSDPIELPLPAAEGEVTLAVPKLLTGKRDLTFRLETAAGALVEGPGAVVVIPGVVISGPR